MAIDEVLRTTLSDIFTEVQGTATVLQELPADASASALREAADTQAARLHRVLEQLNIAGDAMAEAMMAVLAI